MLISTDDRLSFEKSKSGRVAVNFSSEKFFLKDCEESIPPQLLRQTEIDFPELSEPEIVRHFINLSRKNFSVDTHFYPLGSCTMKYNPKINEWAARLDAFACVHPLQNKKSIQGILQIFGELEDSLKSIMGMDNFTLQPAAGAHGELTGMMIVRAYHDSRGDTKRIKILTPDSSHGTNPASAALLGFKVIEIKSLPTGQVDIEDLKRHLGNDVAGLMLTNPNTLGIFDKNILEITRLVHESGGLLYYDGANLNPLLGIARPGDMGFDIIHVNLHKTFSTPHGGGGPGAGPVGVKGFLKEFLPGPLVVKNGDEWQFALQGEKSIGRVKLFYGNTGVIIRAYVYIKSLGKEGLRRAGEAAILNANYMKEKLKSTYAVATEGACMHEFVLSLKNLSSKSVHAGDIGKRLLDYGFHAPTVHFPLVVSEALMIEPTETESLETLDAFCNAMLKIAKEIEENVEIIKSAPHNLPVRRPDDVLAAREPILSYKDQAAKTAAK